MAEGGAGAARFACAGALLCWRCLRRNAQLCSLWKHNLERKEQTCQAISFCFPGSSPLGTGLFPIFALSWLVQISVSPGSLERSVGNRNLSFP